MIPASASFTNAPGQGEPSGRRPRRSTGWRNSRPCSFPRSKSSPPNAGATCTTPLPSSIDTKSPRSTVYAFSTSALLSTATSRPSRNIIGWVPHVVGSYSASYLRPTSSSPRNVATGSSASPSAASTSAAASTTTSSSRSTAAYSASGWTARAVFPGRVQGVVVQATTEIGASEGGDAFLALSAPADSAVTGNFT